MILRYAKFILCFSLLVFCIQPLYACGPSLYEDEGRFALYRPDLGGPNSLEPFYYSERFLNSYSPDPDGKDYKRNCMEWKAYTKGFAKEEDIYNIQYNTDPDNFLYACNSGNWGNLKDNTFIQWLLRKENKRVLDYMKLAKRFEFAQFNSSDPWEAPQSQDFSIFGEVVTMASEQCRISKDPFLKERYAFQVIKSCYYGQQPELLIKTYDQYLSKSNSVVKGWALLYYGMVQTGTAQTRYLLQSFDLSEEKKVFCYNHISRAELDSLEAVTKDKETLHLVLVLRALKTPGRAMELIRKIYAIDPSSRYLPVLIGREINKVEDWVWSPEILNFYSAIQTSYYYSLNTDDNERWNGGYEKVAAKNLSKDRVYLDSLKSWLTEILENRNKNDNMLHLAIAHLDNMEGKYGAALERLDHLSTFRDTAMETQRLLDKSLAIAYVKDVLQAATRQELADNMNKIKALNATMDKDRDTKQFYESFYEDGVAGDERNDDLPELMLMLSMRFRERGDRVTAGLLYNKANLTSNIYDSWYSYGSDTLVGYKYIAWWDREAEPQDIDSILAFKHRAPRNDFEKLVVPSRWAMDDFYKDLKGTLFIRKKQYREALAVFESMDKNFWENHYEYKTYLPSTTITNLGSYTPWDDPQAPKYPFNSKVLITRELTGLQDSITKEHNKEKLAEYYYRLGNAQFSLTYYGKAWMMMSYGNSVNEGKDATGGFATFTFYPNNKKYGKDYYECGEAVTQYKKALSLGKNRERKAALLLMLSLCDKLSHQYNTTGTDEQQAYISPYLTLALKNCRNTQTMGDALSFCPDIRNP